MNHKNNYVTGFSILEQETRNKTRLCKWFLFVTFLFQFVDHLKSEVNKKLKV